MNAPALRAARLGDWPRLAQLALLLVGEAAWLGGWSLVLGRWLAGGDGGPLVVPLGLLALLAGAAIATRLLLPTNPRLARAALPAMGLALALLTGVLLAGGGLLADLPGLATALLAGQVAWRPSVGAALALVAWWRGLEAGRAPLSLDVVEAGFGRAIVALAVLFLVNAATPAEVAVPAGSLITTALVALSAGLIGLPLARLLEQREAARRQGAPLRVDRHWLTLLLGTVGLLLVVALLIAATLTFDRIEAVLALLAGPLDALLSFILTVLLLPVALALDLLVQFLRQFLRPIEAPELPPRGPNVLDEIRALLANQGEPPGWLPLVRIALALVIVALILSFLARSLFRPPADRPADEVEEIRDSVWSWPAARAALWDWLLALIRRRRAPALPPASAGTASALPADRRLWGPRELYRALLHLGGRLGRRREPAETPHEYERALGATDPLIPGERALSVLTDLFERDRYGPAPPPDEAVAAGHAALTELEALADRPIDAPITGPPGVGLSP